MRFSIPFLSFAIAVAIGLHAGAFYLIQNAGHAFIYTSSKALWENQKIEPSQPTLSRQETQQRNRELAEIFKEIQRPPESAEKVVEWIPQTDTVLMPTTSLQAEADLTVAQADAVSEMLVPNRQDLVEELLKAQELAQGPLDTSHTETLSPLQTLKVGFDEGSIAGTAAYSTLGFSEQGAANPLVNQLLQNFKTTGVGLPGLAQDPLRGFNPNSLTTVASGDDFVLTVRVGRRTEGPGYVFKLELTPKPGVRFKHITQNYFFLIDRSQSIRSQRYELTKQAVGQALSMLNPADTFNILLFDDKVKAFSAKNVSWTEDNVARAKIFMSKNHYGQLFANTDLYTSLGRIVPDAVAEKEVNTAILLSDGDTHLKPDKQRETIVNWTRRNGGKVTLYSVAAGKGNNQPLLDLLSAFNRGFLRYAANEKELPNSLLALMQTIRQPIGKEIKVRAVADAKDAKIVLFPPNSFLPNLQQTAPFIIYGTIDRLRDFHVFYQGKYYDKYLDIKKRVSFAQAGPGDVVLYERKLALYKAYKHYESYLADGDSAHLTQAKQMLQAHQLPVVFD